MQGDKAWSTRRPAGENDNDGSDMLSITTSGWLCSIIKKSVETYKIYIFKE
jgi:hypothetical protein